MLAVCTPYTPPHRQYYSLEQLVAGGLPQFQYQIHLASGEVEKVVKDEASIRAFLKGLYGAKGPNGEEAFDPEKGVLVENLPKIGESRLLNGKVNCSVLRRWIDVGCCTGGVVAEMLRPRDPDLPQLHQSTTISRRISGF